MNNNYDLGNIISNGNSVNINGANLVYTGDRWVYRYSNTVDANIGNETLKGEWPMSNSTPNLYRDLLFTRDWTFEPWTAVNVKTGKVAGKVFEVSRVTVNGLGSSNSLYATAGTDGKPVFPYLSWNALLEKLEG